MNRANGNPVNEAFAAALSQRLAELDEAGPPEVTLALGLNHATRTMVLAFGAVVGWIELTPHEARTLAIALVEHARQLEQRAATQENPLNDQTWLKFRRTAVAEMRPYVPGEDLSKVSVANVEEPQAGGMIARNPANHDDQWYVGPDYVAANFEPLPPAAAS